jgi:hypothetical protein
VTEPLVNIDRMFATWTDPTGVTWPLSDIGPDRGWFTTREVGGWGAVPFEYTLDPLPRGGQEVRFIRSDAARLTWPLYIYGDTHTEFLENYRAIRRAIMMTAHRGAAGTLRVARPDGTAREIDAFYEDGFRGDPGQNWMFASPVITFLCPDGYWRDTTPLSLTREYAPGSSFLDPFPTISSGQVLGATTMDNPGDTMAWPFWTITGPTSGLTATNLTTGYSFTLSESLSDGQQILITTQRPSVRGPGDTNLVGSLNWPDAYLWGLMPGLNDVEFSVAGSGAGTSIEFLFYPRYEGA